MRLLSVSLDNVFLSCSSTRLSFSSDCLSCSSASCLFYLSLISSDGIYLDSSIFDCAVSCSLISFCLLSEKLSAFSTISKTNSCDNEEVLNLIAFSSASFFAFSNPPLSAFLCS
jgi:hypothetical protein